MRAKIGDLHRWVQERSDSLTMILTCPQCATRYFLDDGLIGPAGRSVQCGRCAEVWRAEPGPGLQAEPAPADSPIQALAPEPDAPKAWDPEPEPPPRPVDPIASAPALEEPIPAETVPTEPVLPAPPEPETLGHLGSPFAASRQRASEHRTRRPQRRGGGILAAAVSVLAVLITVVALAILLEPQIVEQWPGVAGLYAAVGLPTEAATPGKANPKKSGPH